MVRRYHSLVVVVAGEGTDLRVTTFFAVNTPHSSVNTRSTALNGLGGAFYDFYVLFGAIITEPRCIFGITVSPPTSNASKKWLSIKNRLALSTAPEQRKPSAP